MSLTGWGNWCDWKKPLKHRNSPHTGWRWESNPQSQRQAYTPLSHHAPSCIIPPTTNWPKVLYSLHMNVKEWACVFVCVCFTFLLLFASLLAFVSGAPYAVQSPHPWCLVWKILSCLLSLRDTIDNTGVINVHENLILLIVCIMSSLSNTITSLFTFLLIRCIALHIQSSFSPPFFLLLTLLPFFVSVYPIW